MLPYSIGLKGRTRALPREEMQRWCADPLAHPAVERMTERELGDLPWPRFTVRQERR